MTTSQRVLAGIVAAAIALILLFVVGKDTGLIHGTATPGAIYCTALADRYDSAVADRDECVDMFNSLDTDTRQALMEDLAR